jgi:hypothetical protein
MSVFLRPGIEQALQQFARTVVDGRLTAPEAVLLRLRVNELLNELSRRPQYYRHCGHPRTSDNTYTTATRLERCRICQMRYSTRWRHKQRTPNHERRERAPASPSALSGG